MPLTTPIEEYQNQIHAMPSAQNLPESGFAENWSASLGLSLTEDLPILSRMIPSATAQMRAKQLYDYAKQYPELDEYMQKAWLSEGEDMERAAHYAHDVLGLTDVPVRADYEKRKDEEYDDYRQYTKSVQDRQNGWGVIGQFAGSAHASQLDPLYMLGFFTGYGGASTVLQAATRTAIIEGALETVATPFIMDWKDTVGANYGMSDALTSILVTMGTAGTLGATGKFLGSKIEAARQSQLSVKKATEFIEKHIADNPADAVELESLLHVMKNSPDQDMDVAKLLSANIDLIDKWNKAGPRSHVGKTTDPKQTKQQFVSEQSKLAEATANTSRAEAKMIDELVIEDEIARIEREVVNSPEIQELVAELDKYRDWFGDELLDHAHPNLLNRVREIQETLRSPEMLDAKAQIRELKKLKKELPKYYDNPQELRKATEVVEAVEETLEEVDTAVRRRTETTELTGDIHKMVVKEYTTVEEMNVVLDELDSIKARDC